METVPSMKASILLGNSCASANSGAPSQMSAKVIAKGLGSSIVGGFALDGYYGVKQHAYENKRFVDRRGG